jgi:hypothetical protein
MDSVIYNFIETSTSWGLLYISTTNETGLLSRSGNALVGAYELSDYPPEARVNLMNGSGQTWNSGTKSFTFTGRKAIINTLVDNITMVPAQNTSFEMRYTGTTPAAATSLRNQNINKV